MPPDRVKVPTERKAPAFKPPRPTNKSKESTSKAAPRRKSGPIQPEPSSFSSDDEPVVETSHRSSPEATNNTMSTRESPPTIPSKLLTKLLQHHFQDNQTRIGKDANAVVGKYMETFVREAIARAVYERSEADGGKGRGVDFLEAWHLVYMERRVTC